MITNKDSLSHAACKRTDTVFSYFTKPNFLSKLRHWLSPSLTSSPHFARLSIFANFDFIHDLSCNTRKPTEQWTVICDAHAYVLFSWGPGVSYIVVTTRATISTRSLVMWSPPSGPWLPLPNMLESPHMKLFRARLSTIPAKKQIQVVNFFQNPSVRRKLQNEFYCRTFDFQKQNVRMKLQ